MKAKKIFASVLAATLCASALALSANAAQKFVGDVNGVSVSGSISINKTGARATVMMGGNPYDYEIFQAQINMRCTARNNIDGQKITKPGHSDWMDGGNGCSVRHPVDYTIVSAKAQNDFNVNGVIRTFYDNV